MVGRKESSPLRRNMDFQQALEELERIPTTELSIIRLAEPISSEIPSAGAKRESDVSTDASNTPSPANLAADLAHYKVLYLSINIQITKL
jgi:hypothetical protein